MPVSLLDFPSEILDAILECLNLPDLFRFCSTCRTVRETFRPDKMIWLVDHFDNGHVPSRDAAAAACSHLLLCHALLRILQQRGMRRDLQLLFRHGASLRSVPAGKLLSDTYVRSGPGRRVDFLLEHGASFDQIPGGINQVLEDTVRRGMWRKMHITWLLGEGASLSNVPCGFEQLLEDLYKRDKGLRQKTLEFLLQHGGPLSCTLDRLDLHLRRAFVVYRLQGPHMELLLKKIPDALVILMVFAILSKTAKYEEDLESAMEPLIRYKMPAYRMPPSLAGDDAVLAMMEAFVKDEDSESSRRIRTALLYWAINCENVTFVRTLLERGVDVESVIYNDWKPLTIAAKRGNVEILCMLLENGASAEATVDQNTSNNALFYAAESGSMQSLELLLDYEFNINASTRVGQTALMAATERGDREMVAYLLKKGADPNKLAIYSNNALASAGCRGDVDIARLLLEHGADPTQALRSMVFVSEEDGILEVVKLLLENGADIAKQTGRDNSTIFYLAARSRNVRMMGLFLDRAPPHLMSVGEGEEGLTPLHAAAQLGFAYAVEAFLERGQDPNVVDRKGQTPLHAACYIPNMDIILALLNYGADPEAVDLDGKTPLSMCSTHVSVIQALQELIDTGNASSEAGEFHKALLQVQVQPDGAGI